MQKLHPLRIARETHNLTRERLAKEIGIGAATIKRAEHWEPINADSRQRLCQFFECSSEQLGLQSSEGEEEKMPFAISTTLTNYIQQQRYRLFHTMAPGATTLRVGEIIERDNLFIPPSWQLLHGPTPSQNLTDYLLQALLQRQRVLLLGDAGQGKTTILKLIFTRLADRWLSDPASPLPIYVALREFTSFSENALDILWAHVEEEFPLPYEEFVTLTRKKHITFLFDGFDEIRGEINQRSVNERAASNIFQYPSLLSCRKSFFDVYLTMSPLQERYSSIIELCPLSFDESVTHYITAFCQQRQQGTPEDLTISPEKIIETIQVSPELQDLAQRPLFLLMILEVFTSAGEDLDEKRWSITKLYQQYTERWLKHEAAKPDATLKWHEKAALLQEMAWQTTMGSSLQHTVFSLEELHTFIHRSLAKHTDKTEAQLLDDLCFRTLLGMAEGSSYAFLHKSFQEYYAARYVFTCMRRRNAPEAIEQTLRSSLPFDIATYLKKMLRESSPSEKSLIAANLMDVYQRNQQQNQTTATIRQQATYYLSNLRTEEATHFLESVCHEEPNKWAQRGIMLGLALYAGKAEMLEQYIQIIRKDAQAAAINTKYHLIYYGDQAGDPDTLDALEQSIMHSEKTVAALFRHLQNERYQNGWALDLFTLSALLELQGPSILSTHVWYLPFLKEFLEKDHVDHGVTLLQEKKRLQEFIEGDCIEQR